MNRRAFLASATTLSAIAGSPFRLAHATESATVFSYPIGWPAGLPGDGFRIRHGYACENTWYNPGYWHTGEDWYALEGETAGAAIMAIAAGEVVFAGSDYPGRVVIVRHESELFSMYGHLDYGLAVGVGDRVEAGQSLGAVLLQTNAAAPSHLHFEVRTFLTTFEVNGDGPRYGFACGFQCPPGPGYWPIDAPEHPSAMGWRNPTHVIARRTFPDAVPSGATLVIADGVDEPLPIFSTPGTDDAILVGELSPESGNRYALRGISHGREATSRTSAEGYELWYEIEAEVNGWVQATIPSHFDTGSDGRPSSVELALLIDPDRS